MSWVQKNGETKSIFLSSSKIFVVFCIIAIFECLNEAGKWFYVPKIFRQYKGLNFNDTWQKSTKYIFLYCLQEVIYMNSSDLSFTLHNHIMQLWYHPVKLRLKISFAGIPILVQEIANEPSLKKLFILNVFLYHLFS